MRLREHTDRSNDRLVLVYAVQREVIISRAQAISEDRRATRAAEARRRRVALGIGNAIATRTRVALVEESGVRQHSREAAVYARREQSQVGEVAITQRQLGNLAPSDNLTLRTGLCIQQRRFRGYHHLFGGSAYLQRQIDLADVADAQLDIVAHRRLETSLRRFYLVDAHLQDGRHYESPVLIRHGFKRGSRIHVRNLDCSTRN